MARIPRIMLAAPQSGSGKTLLTCALLQALLDENRKPAAFKCGPDYIDPMFHKTVLHIPSGNLDTFFTDGMLTGSLLAERAKNCDIAVLEGVMGLYDGLAGIKEEASSYDLAKKTGTPIILIVNAKGMGRSVLPLLSGFLQYDKEHLIRGVLLNRTGRMFGQQLKAEIEKELGLPVFGSFPELKEAAVESRHLGLVLPEEMDDITKRLREAADVFKESADLEAILKTAETAGELATEPLPSPVLGPDSMDRGEKVRIGVAKDEAFCFYYGENLELLQKAGAECVYFSPLHDKNIPENLQGLLLGGGYPELYGKPLSENRQMKESVCGAVHSGMPSIAECGGFMYLHEWMEDTDGTRFPMAGAIHGTCSFQKKPVRFGYLSLCSGADSFLKEGETIKGHEYHYFDSDQNGASCTAVKPVTKKSWSCVHADSDHWWGFPHLYYYSNPAFVTRFVEKAREYGGKVKK